MSKPSPTFEGTILGRELRLEETLVPKSNIPAIFFLQQLKHLAFENVRSLRVLGWYNMAPMLLLFRLGNWS
jgi:hypothetical protein